MKLFDKSTEVESINITYKNGQSYAIWLPKEVDVALKLLVDEDEEGDYDPNNLDCELTIRGIAKWDNINIAEG